MLGGDIIPIIKPNTISTPTCSDFIHQNYNNLRKSEEEKIDDTRRLTDFCKELKAISKNANVLHEMLFTPQQSNDYPDFISRKKLISIFARELAKKHKRADYWLYIINDKDMSSYVLEVVEEIKALATELEIIKEVYEEAYTIYDFRNSGKKGYQPNLNDLHWEGL